MNGKGSFWVYRGIWDSPEFSREPFTEREAWLWMISEAAWRPYQRRIEGHVIYLQRGQLAASVRFLAQAWQWSKSRVQRFIWRLKIGSMIGTTEGGRINVITICNYNKYQVPTPAYAENSGTTLGTTVGQERDKREELKEVNNKKERESGAIAPSRATRLPNGWKPSEENIQYAIDRGFIRAEVQRIGEDFHDYWVPKSGQGATKTNWNLTWGKWIRTEADKQKKSRVRPMAEIGFYATENSQELMAWDAYHRRTKGTNAPRDRRFGWTFPTRWPPDHNQGLFDRVRAEK